MRTRIKSGVSETTKEVEELLSGPVDCHCRVCACQGTAPVARAVKAESSVDLGVKLCAVCGGKARSFDSRRTNVHGMYLSSCCNLFSKISTSFSRNENVRSETSIDFDSLERPFVRESAMPRSVRLYTNLHYPLSEHLAVVAVSVS